MGIGIESVPRMIDRRCWVLSIALALSLDACGKEPDRNQLPVSHWVNDRDPCVQRTAKAIVDSGRPWPNEVSTGTGTNWRLRAYDVWILNQRHEMPGEPRFLVPNGSPKHHPWKYTAVAGNVERLLGIPKREFKDPRVGGTLYGNIYCLLNLPTTEWVENRSETHPTVASIQAFQRGSPSSFKVFEVQDRKDIGMTEVFARTDLNPPGGGRDVESVTYLPTRRQLRQGVNGVVYDKAIDCGRRHDVNGPLSLGETCSTWIWLQPGVHLYVQVYQQYLPLLPEVHDKMLDIIKNSKRK